MNSYLKSALVLATAQAVSDVAWTSMGHFKIKDPAFLSVTKFHDSDEFLLVSSFSAFGNGSLYVVKDIKEAISTPNVAGMKDSKLKQGKFQWPNNVQVIPKEVFGDNVRAIVVPDGFLVPGHANGGVYIVIVDNDDITNATECYTMTHNKDGYFYHMGEWIDMNKDGRLDFVTAKSNAKAGGGRLVWYEHPEGGLADMPWTEHLITEGPDVSITFDHDIVKPDIMVYAGQFFDESVNMYQISKNGGTVVKSRVIDDVHILSAY